LHEQEILLKEIHVLIKYLREYYEELVSI